MSSEQQLLKVIRKLVPSSDKYLLDDAAIIEKNLVVTTDSLIENTHFSRRAYTPEEIGWKALAINLSDIASMGAKPLYALVALCLPKSINKKWVKRLYKGILSCAKKYKTQIIGGNLARSKEISITITVIGKTAVGAGFKPAFRSNAKPGDLIFTTGTFGDSAAGLLLSRVGARGRVPQQRQLIKSYKIPTPQIETGIKIAKSCSRVALIDASDGLADCLIQIAKESKVKIITFENTIPISSSTKQVLKVFKRNPTDIALYGGEDYELVGTASEKDCNKLRKLKNIKIIGKVFKGNGAFLKQKNGKLVRLDMRKTYEHFK